MTSVDSLENLTNTEIRIKCKEYGLPNVPVTDSSRKLLIKKLRNSMSAKDVVTKEATATATTKASGRRETMHVSKTTEATNNEALSLSQPAKSRRTIAAVSTVATKDDASAVVATSIPISTRRRSVSKDVEAKPVKPSSKVAPIESVVIEDDEEDNDLVMALENAEKESTTSSVAIETITSRRKSRSASVPKDVETAPKVNKRRAMTPLIEEVIAKEKGLLNKPKPTPIPEVTVSNNNAVSQKSYQPAVSSISTTFTQPTPKEPVSMSGSWYGVYDQEQKSAPKTGFENSTSRYSTLSTTSTVYSSPTMQYSIGLGSNAISYRSKYTAYNLMNEQSDVDVNNDENDGIQSPYLSKFVRNLERSRSIGRSSMGFGGNYKRRSGSNYDCIHGRYAQSEPTFGDLIRDLNRKYKLQTILILITVFLIFVFAYVWMFSP